MSNTHVLQRLKDLVAVLLMLVLAARCADAATPLPSGGSSLLTGDPLVSFSHHGFERLVVNVAGQSFNRALEVRTTNAPPAPWSLEFGDFLNRNVARNDVALLRFFARAVVGMGETGEAMFSVYSQLHQAPWTKSMHQVHTVGSEWREFLIPYAFVADYPQGTHKLVFGLGFGPQTIQIGGIELLGYGTSRRIEDLPVTRLSYPGRELDAAWRVAATQRIDAHRKDEMAFEIIGYDGEPLVGAKISIDLEQHAFPFSTAFSSRLILENSERGSNYREKLLEYFNAAGPENDLKWPAWDGEWGTEYDRAQTLAALNWLRPRMRHLRGHVMVWPGFDNLPSSIRSLIGTSRQPEIPGLVLNHIDSVATATSGLIDSWDVLNEPYDNHLLMDLFGNQIMVNWFQRARTRLPNAQLFLNDYGIETDGGRNVAHRQHFLDTLGYLRSQNSGMNGAGIQGHFGSALTAPTTVYEIFDEVVASGVERIHITEFDVDLTDRQLQADYLRDYYTVAFSHPKVELIQMWGFWAGAHWRPDAAIFNLDWTERPAAAALHRLLRETWHTRANGTADTAGNWSTRAFLGRYRVRVEHGSRVWEGAIELDRDAGPIQITPLDTVPRISTRSEGDAKWLDVHYGSPGSLEISRNLQSWVPAPDGGEVIYQDGTRQVRRVSWALPMAEPLFVRLRLP